MLIEQIIEFELRGSGPLALHVLLWLVNFMKENSLSGFFCCLNIAEGNVPYFPLYGPKITYN